MRKADLISEALRFDPLDTARRLTEGTGTGGEEVSKLGMVLAKEHNELKQQLLFESDDSFFNMSFGDFLFLAERLGFAKVLDEPIENTEDRFTLHWRSGMLLKLESYRKHTNSATVYFNFKGHPLDLMPIGSSFLKDDVDGEGIFFLQQDVREGFRWALERIERTGTILAKWVGEERIWLVDHEQERHKNLDWMSIIEGRITRLPPEIRRAMARA